VDYATKRSRGRKAASERRVSGTFVALPTRVIDSAAYRGVSHTARSLLIDLARQYNGRNNGTLVASASYLERLGWKSHDTITKALRDLLGAQLIFQTRVGARPNRAAWFALTWIDLDRVPGMDAEAMMFRKGMFDQPPVLLNTPARAVSRALRAVDELAEA
jgi:hypothetical protein